MAETDLMPPIPGAELLDPEEAQRRRAAAALGGTMPPVMAYGSSRPPASPQPSSQPAGPPLPPIGPSPIQPRSPANNGELAGRAREIALGATSQPRMLAIQPPQPGAPPDSAIPPIKPPANAIPAVGVSTPNTLPQPRELQPSGDRDFSGATAAPVQPGASSAMPPVKLGPAAQREQDWLAKGPPQPKWWQKALEIAGSIHPLGRLIESQIPSTPLGYNTQLNAAAMRAAKEQGLTTGQQGIEAGQRAAQTAQENTRAGREAFLKQNPDVQLTPFERADFLTTGKMPQREPTASKPPAEDKKVDEGYNAQGQRVVTYQKPDGTRYDTTNPNIIQKPPEEAAKLSGEVEAQVGPKPTTAQYSGKTYPSVQAAQAAWGKAAEKIKHEENPTFVQQGQDEKAVEIAAQAIAHGDLSRLKDISSFRGDQRLLIFARAKEINPSFNLADIDRKISMMDLYTKGTQGNQLQSFGTFLEHAGALKDTMESLQGVTSEKILNHGINWLRKNVNDDPAYPKVLAALDPVQKEFETYLLNNRALYTEDRATVDQIINGDLPIGQMGGALEQMGHTVQARYNEAGNRFKNTMGKSLEEMGLTLTYEALEGAKKIGVKIGTGSGTTPSKALPPGWK